MANDKEITLYRAVKDGRMLVAPRIFLADPPGTVRWTKLAPLAAAFASATAAQAAVGPDGRAVAFVRRLWSGQDEEIPL